MPSTPAEAKVLVDKLTQQQHDAEDQYNQVNADFAKSAAQMDQRSAEIATQNDKIAKLRSSISAMALSRYHNRGQETSQALLSSNTQDLIRKLSTIDHTDGALNAGLQQLQAENGNLTELNRQQAVDLAKNKADVDKLGQLAAAAQDDLARANALLGTLTEADRKAHEDAEAKRQAEADAKPNTYTARTDTKPNTQAKPATQTPAADAATTTAKDSDSSSTSATGLKSSPKARGNFYTAGSCVWYAYNRRVELGAPISSSWGNASAWPANAAADGYRVDHVPQVGAAFSTMAWGASTVLGHAGVVEEVYSNGSFRVSEMDFPTPFHVSGRTLPAAAAASFYFIH